jgi:RNA polymerase sigma factor (sigma-70 family)
LPDQLAAANELEALVQRAIDALPERRRLALMLRLVHQMSFAEVGEVMQISEKAAFILVSRARAALQPLLDHL